MTYVSRVSRVGLRRPAPRAAISIRPDVTIVIPTRNEAGNIDELVARLDRSLRGVNAELLFVDDSDDHTPEVIQAAAARSTRPVRLLHREAGHREGRLGGAVVAGFQLARAPWAVVIDGDLQHPPEAVPSVLDARLGPGVDLVYGTRYVESGNATGLSGRGRVWVSAFSTWLTKAMFPRKLRGVSDPMSGFFAVRLAALDLRTLRPVGYKVLLEILAGARIRGTVGVPFSFQPRFSGESKASLAEGGRFLAQLAALRLGMSVSKLLRLVGFLTVGATGVAVNTAVLLLLTGPLLNEPYLLASALATNVAIVWNFGLMETWVFRKVRKGSLWARFCRFWLVNTVLLPVQLAMLAVCVEFVGLRPVVANVGVLALIFVLRYLLTSMWVYSWQALTPLPSREASAGGADAASQRHPSRQRWAHPYFLLRLMLPVVVTLLAFPSIVLRFGHLLRSGESVAGIALAGAAVVAIVVQQAAPKAGDADVHDRQVDVILAAPLMIAAVWLSSRSSLVQVWSTREALAAEAFLVGSALLLIGTRLVGRLRWALGLPLLSLPVVGHHPMVGWAVVLLISLVVIRRALPRSGRGSSGGLPGGNSQHLPRWRVAAAVVTAVACTLAYSAVSTGAGQVPTAQHAP